MSFKHIQGFTLMEITVVMLIMGILAAVSVPSYTSFTEKARAQDAKNNLLSIYAGQLNYFNNTGVYCTDTTPVVGTKCTSLDNINSALALNIPTNGFSYSCTNANTFTCIADRDGYNPAGIYRLTLRGDQSINLTTTGTINPTCVSPAGNSYCP